MLLKREHRASDADWNRRFHAPFGRQDLVARVARRMLDKVGAGGSDLRLRITGPFSIQGNNDTRVVEYPWAFAEVGPRDGLVVVEIGGALSGFQFALSRSGCIVTNVDPGEADQEHWELSLRLNQESMARLNRLYSSSVTLKGCVLQDAGIPSASVDRVVSVSTIEHVPPEEIAALAREIARILRPGGRCVLTIDLFLDLEPFTDKQANAYGTNIDVRALVEASGLELVKGETSQLVGYDDFDPIAVLRDLGDYFIGTGYPVCAQALVLVKP